MSDAVATWLAGLDPATRATADALRAIVADAAPELAEEIKWNAPSFRDGSDHQVTLGLERKGGIRLVLHRGVASKDAAGFAFDDPARLARWAAVDRGVMIFTDAAAVAARRDALADIVALDRRHPRRRVTSRVRAPT